MSDDLRNCPFCGGSMEDNSIDIDIKKDVASEIVIRCRCGGMVRARVHDDIYPTRLQAIEKAKRGAMGLWNGFHNHGREDPERAGD